MKKKLIWFFLWLCFFSLSGFFIFVNWQKNEINKPAEDYIASHFIAPYHRLDLRSQWLKNIPNICSDYTGEILLDIRSLDLWDNQISSIDTDLSCLVHLQELDLSYNNIVSVRELGKLPNLLSLNLQNNHIQKISGLSDVQNLFSLNLWSNRIKSLDFLSDLSQLQELQLQNNTISDVSIIKELKNLKTLNIEFNQIPQEDIEWLQKIDYLQELTTWQ